MSSYAEGQVHQLANALESSGFTPDDVTKLGQFKDLSGIRGLFRGTHELKLIKKHIIDCDAKPFVPKGWKVESHLTCGQLEWNPKMISLCLLYGEKQRGSICKERLFTMCENIPKFNANVLGYILNKPSLISRDWKDKSVLFPGTIYRNCDDNLCVLYLRWRKYCQWHWCAHDLGCSFLAEDHPAVLRVN
jgi:hypothetical protein